MMDAAEAALIDAAWPGPDPYRAVPRRPAVAALAAQMAQLQEKAAGLTLTSLDGRTCRSSSPKPTS
jgi:hypothetical protein